MMYTQVKDKWELEVDMMKAIRVAAEVHEDRRIVFNLPKDTPTGQAEVIVLLPDESKHEQRQTLQEFLTSLETLRIPGRTRDEIDKYILDERSGWD